MIGKRRTITTHTRKSRADDDLRIHWRTPDWILEGVREVFGGQIELDPCGNAASLASVAAVVACVMPEEALPSAACPHSYRITSGLSWAWEVNENAFVNPSYGVRHNPLWAKKFREEVRLRHHHRGPMIALVPAMTGTAWFREYVAAADSIVFVGRVKFVGAEHFSMFDLALVYSGDKREVFENVFGKHGWRARIKRV